MMNYVNAEMLKLTKKVTAVHACVLMSGAFLGEKTKMLKMEYNQISSKSVTLSRVFLWEHVSLKYASDWQHRHDASV